MIRSISLAGVLAGIHLFGTAGAVAEPPAEYCPRGPVALYFASGAITATPQVDALMGKIGDTATSCEADRIDIIAHIDPNVDGGRALLVSLERLKLLAGDLMEQGVPADRIRVAALAAHAGEAPTAGFSQVDVLFRKAEIADDPAQVQTIGASAI
jgi:hypothetical protein